MLARSLSEQETGARLIVVLINTDAGLAPSDLMDMVAAETLFPKQEWEHRLCYYDLIELATSIKPKCFSHLFAQGYDTAVYLDPDIQVLKPFDELRRALAETDAVFTPHLLTPLPADGKVPDDLRILRSGTYNLGFAAFRNTAWTHGILDWWDAQLHTMGVVDIAEGVFADQKWVNLVPAFAGNAHILRHPGYNIAYWNLHERTVRNVDGHWRVRFVDGSEHDAIFFHFSGYSPDLKIVSRYENRYLAAPPGDTGDLLALYAGALASAGHQQFRDRLPAVTRFKSGVRWNSLYRALYRQAKKAGADIGAPLKDQAFLRWMAENEPGDHLPHFLRALMQHRPDLADTFNDGRDINGLRTWLRSSGVLEYDIDPGLLQLLDGSSGSAAVEDGVPDPQHVGINYVGYLSSHLGVAEAARNSISALRAADVGVKAIDISVLAPSPAGNYDDPRPPRGAPEPAYPITILGVNADTTPGVIAGLPADIGATFRIGFWNWETGDFPEQWCSRFDLVNEVWVGSRFVADAVSAKSTVPVLVMPYMVAPPPLAPDRAWLTRLLPGIADDEFLFLFQFDVASVPFRKNPEGVIAAFKMAFDAREPVRLIIKVMNGDLDRALLGRLRDLAEGSRITLRDLALESLDRFRLLATVDCFVSLHRSEGFGLSIAEAMAYARPVVTTNWSGNTDFTTATNAALVDFDLVMSDRQYGPYRAGTVWAEPRLASAAAQMRRVFSDVAWRTSIGAAAAETVRSTLSAEVVGAAMRTRLERLHRSGKLARPQGADTLSAGEPGPQAPPSPVRSTLADVIRFPKYYLRRARLLPGLVAKFGIIGTLQRLTVVAGRNDKVDDQGPRGLS